MPSKNNWSLLLPRRDELEFSKRKYSIPLLYMLFSNVGQYHCIANYFPITQQQQTGRRRRRRRGINAVCIDATLFLECIFTTKAHLRDNFSKHHKSPVMATCSWCRAHSIGEREKWKYYTFNCRSLHWKNEWDLLLHIFRRLTNHKILFDHNSSQWLWICILLNRVQFLVFVPYLTQQVHGP